MSIYLKSERQERVEFETELARYTLGLDDSHCPQE